MDLMRNAREPAPHTLTLAEYKRRELERARAAIEPRTPPRPGHLFMYEPRERRRLDEAAATFAYLSRPGVLEDAHRRAVVEAIAARKPIDAEVLADYPDLQERARQHRAPLSRVVAGVNARHEPPGGFTEADAIARNTRDWPVANTIRAQLGRTTLAMLGAHEFVVWPDGVQFAIKGSPKRVTKIWIALEPDDTYAVEFFRGNGINLARAAAYRGIYVDQLHDLIERETGLYTALRQATVYGHKYSRELGGAEIAAAVRNDIKEAVKRGDLPRAKYSARLQRFAGGKSITITYADVPFELFNPKFLKFEIETDGRKFYEGDRFSPERKTLEKKLTEIASAYNFDGSDTQSDYFNVNFYLHVHADHEYERRQREVERKRAQQEVDAERARRAIDDDSESPIYRSMSRRQAETLDRRRNVDARAPIFWPPRTWGRQ